LTVAEIFKRVNLSPCGPKPWLTSIPEDEPGIYVVSLAGKPELGCDISANYLEPLDPSGSPLTSVLTDDTGGYRVFGLAAGRYLLLGRRPRQDASPLCSGCTVQRWADPIEIGAGTEVSSIDLRFEPEPAQHTTTGASPLEEEPRGSISGLVISAQSDTGIKSATVRLTSLRQGKLLTLSTTTLSGGVFKFDHLEAGSYGLFVQKAGYEPKSLPRQIPLIENQSRTGVDVRLNRAPTISGGVSGLDGNPVAGAEVSVYRLLWRNARPVAVKSATARTDDRGVYRLAELPVGGYLLAASLPALANTTPQGNLDFGTGRVFYPSARSPSQAQTLNVSYGQELTEINVSLFAQETFSVSGVVTDAETGEACVSCAIRAVNLDESYNLVQAQADVARGGSFNVRGLVAGSYRIVAEKNSDGRRLLSSQIVVIADRDLKGIHLRAGVPHALAGRVVLESPPPDPKAHKVELHVQFSIADGIGPVESVPVESDGSFAVSNLSNETYRLRIEGLPEGGYLRAVQSAGRELPGPVISEDASLPTLELIVSFKSANRAGQVKATKEASAERTPATAEVILVPRDNESPYLTSVHARTHPDGAFKLTSVPPGSYTAFAFSGDSKLDWEDPKVRQRLQSYGRNVTLEAGKSEVVELPLAPEDQD